MIDLQSALGVYGLGLDDLFSRHVPDLAKTLDLGLGPCLETNNLLGHALLLTKGS